MFKEAYEQIRSSYEKDISIYPPVLLADASISEHPNLLFFIVRKENTEAALVNSQSGEIMGVVSIQGRPFNNRVRYNIDKIDEEITNICILVSENNPSIQDVYTAYLQKNFTNNSELNLAASLCPNAISRALLVKLGDTPREAKKALSEIGRKIVFMEKTVPEVIKNIPAWIDSVPTAKAYKNAVVAGNGEKLFRVIKLSGNQEAYMTCVTDFARFLCSMNMVENEHVSESVAGYIHSNCEQINDKPGHYWFFDDQHNPKPGTRMITFDITKVKVEKKEIKQLIEKIGLIVDYDTMKLFLEDYPGWEKVGEADFINNTILAHYGLYDDSVLKASDLEWLTESIKEVLSKSNEISTGVRSEKTEVKRNEVNSIQEERSEADAPKIQHETVNENASKLVVSTESIRTEAVKNSIENESKREEDTTEIKAATLMGMLQHEESASNETEESTKTQNLNTEAMPTSSEEKKNEKNQDPDDTPEPEGYHEETAESAKAKSIYNKKLNNQIYEIYEQTVSQLKARRDVRWNDFISDYRKAMETEDYNVKTGARFLNMTSRDVSSPIYKLLYDTDQATKKYQMDLKRIHKKSMCFACHKEFDADLTFAKHKEHTSKCPNCGNLVRMTIDWLN